MRPPDADLLAVVQAAWPVPIDRLEPLDVGSGGQHRRATNGGLNVYVVTHHPAGSSPGLEAACAGASDLAFALDFAVAPVPTSLGAYTVPLGDGLVTVTLWVAGEVLGTGPLTTRADAEESARQLARLHGVPPRSSLPRWEPLTSEALAGVAARSPEQGRRVATYLLLVEEARTRPWVATHGAPHTGHQRRTLAGTTVLLGWESLAVAPRERDLATLVDSGYDDLAAAYPPMLEMFALERGLAALL